MEITKREIFFSVVIVCLMLIVGFIISDKINDSVMEQHQKYNTALQINEDTDLFQYGMRTNVGNAFVYGDLVAVDPVSYPEIGGLYGSVTRVTERYTMHTRIVTKTRTTADGKTETYTEIEEYWTWDEIDRDRIHASTIAFLGVEFPYGTIDGFYESHITTIRTGYHLRDQYYGSKTSYTGTLFTVLQDGTISQPHFYNNSTIDETIKHLESGFEVVLFWILWIIFICGAVYGFYYLDNKWLEG